MNFLVLRIHLGPYQLKHLVFQWLVLLLSVIDMSLAMETMVYPLLLLKVAKVLHSLINGVVILQKNPAESESVRWEVSH